MVNASGADVRPDSVAVEFDDERLVANAGLLLTSTLSRRLGLESLVEEAVDLGSARRRRTAGRKVLSLVHAIAAGADSIDDADLLRAGATERILGHKAMAPSTLGTFLRAFTFGHVRQLDRVLASAIERAWAAGAGPSDERLVVDVDSFIGEVQGYAKQGAEVGYTGERGYHPLLASRADTGEVLHVRLRKGRAASSRGVVRFADELIARVRRAGASGEKLLRADSAFWNHKLIARLEKAGWDYSISVRMQFWVAEAIAAIPESAWQPLADYPEEGEAQIAETTAGGRGSSSAAPASLERRPSSGPTGATSPSSPTGRSRSRWSRPSIASTPSSRPISPTSKIRRSPTFPPEASPPTAPGR